MAKLRLTFITSGPNAIGNTLVVEVTSIMASLPLFSYLAPKRTPACCWWGQRRPLRLPSGGKEDPSASGIDEGLPVSLRLPHPLIPRAAALPQVGSPSILLFSCTCPRNREERVCISLKTLVYDSTIYLTAWLSACFVVLWAQFVFYKKKADGKMQRNNV